MRDSADNNRMVISCLLISSENRTDVWLARIDAARAMSRPRVELCVGIIEYPARYRWAALSTSTHLTGTDGTGRTSTMKREPIRGVCCVACLLSANRLRSSRNGLSAGVNEVVYAVADVA